MSITVTDEREVETSVRRQIFDRINETLIELEKLGKTDGMGVRYEAATHLSGGDIEALAELADDLTQELADAREERTLGYKIASLVTSIYGDASLPDMIFLTVIFIIGGIFGLFLIAFFWDFLIWGPLIKPMLS